jgi:RNA polymerase sigma-70 factor, ECF subfamily
MHRWSPEDVHRCLDPLRRYARVLTRDAGAADELVQETLLRAYERAATFRRGAALKPWLLSILHNLHVGHRRRDAAEARALEAAAAQDARGAGEAEAEQAVLLREVGDRFRALPEAQAAVLHLVAVEGLSYREAADALDVPVGTVMSRLHRARAALREPGPPAEEGRALRLIGGKDAN